MFTKLFDLVTVVEKIDTFYGHDNSSIEALDGSGNNVFVGTSAGGIISFSITETTSESGRTDIRAVEWAKTIVTQGRPVSQLKSASALNRLFALTDGSLHILTMQDLQLLGGPKSRSISCFALNESPNNDDPFSIELAFGTRRRQIVVCEFVTDKFNTIVEVDTDDIPLCLAFDGRCVCYATNVHYYVLHLNNKSTKPLFPINSDQMMPVVRRIAKNEFLLNGLENLGIFATADGASNRPPLFWSAESVKSIAHTYPYVISLSEQFISVHSLLDQQLKQQIPFTGGRFVDEIDGQLFIVSRRNVYKLNPVSWEKQVDSLLTDKLVDEALALAQTARKPGISKEEFQKVFRTLQQKAGFIKFEECKWDEAFELFFQGKVDVREVICLFLNLLPSSSNFIRNSPPLHNIPDVDFVVKRNSEKKLECKNFLKNFLLSVRSEPWTKEFLPELDLAVLKLCAEIQPAKLEDVLLTVGLSTDLDDFERWCQENKHFNAQALILWKLNRAKNALNVWMKLTDHELSDANFKGLDFVFDILSKNDRVNLIYDNFLWFFKHDVDKTVKLLSQCKEIDAEKVLELLKNDQHALRIYLEYLVFDQNCKLEKFHTQLGELYLSSLRPDMNENDEIRQKFRRFLYTSSLYRVHYLMSKVEDSSSMQYEKAILYGKMNEHGKAFDILIEKLKNYNAAEEYCVNFCSKENREQRHIICSTLLHTYLSNERLIFPESLSQIQKLLEKLDDLFFSGDNFVAPVLQLLNSKSVDVDFPEVLKMLPSHWSLSVLTPFLRQSSLKHHESVNNSKLMLRLGEFANVSLDNDKSIVSNKSHVISENDRCATCQNSFIDATCVIYPDGTKVHKNCLKYKHLAPGTQNVFAISSKK